jgi:hypothetical protein
MISHRVVKSLLGMGQALILGALVLAIYPIKAIAVYLLWNWFIVRLGFPPLNYWNAIGLVLLFSAFITNVKKNNGYNLYKNEVKNPDSLDEAFFTTLDTVIKAVFIILFGLAIHSFM